MSTTGKNFLALTTAAGVAANAVVVAIPPSQASQFLGGGSPLAIPLDKFSADLSGTTGYTKNGAVILNLVTSTPVTIDLTSLASVTPNAGDTSFATWNEMVLRNLGSHDVTISPGGSNPARLPFAGTTPTFTLAAGATIRWQVPAGLAVDSTHKNLTFDPGSNNATVSVCIGGA
jgi:hypothetical protein